MAITIRKDIEDLQKAVGDVNELISDDGEVKMLFGMVVTIDQDTGVVSLAEPVEDDN